MLMVYDLRYDDEQFLAFVVEGFAANCFFGLNNIDKCFG